MVVPDSVLFVENTPHSVRLPRRSSLASLAVHGLLLVALFRGRSPIFIAPSSMLGGANGTRITHLYWAQGKNGEVADRDSAFRSHRDSKTQVTWSGARGQEPASNHGAAHQMVADAHESAATNPAPSAGSPYGSLSDGVETGHEIRPALPAVTSEPLVTADDLHGISEGNVVVEITIDEAGHVVDKVVVRSLGPAVDVKVLAALDSWSFRPATRDGVPIPSKQDVVYHFKPL